MNTLTNLVLLSIQVTTNEIIRTDYATTIPSKDFPDTYYLSDPYQVTNKIYTTNYHFGIIQGTNQIQLLTLQQK